MTQDFNLAIAANRIEVEFAERKQAFQDEIKRIKGDLTRRGMLRSGWAVTNLVGAIRQEMEIRSLLAWQVVSRVLTGQQILLDSGSSDFIKAWIAERLVAGFGDVEGEYRFLSDNIGIGSPPAYAELVANSRQKLFSEIDLSVLEATRVQEETGSKNVVNIYQPYGIIQTGSGATATWSQEFGVEQREMLSRALEAVEAVMVEAFHGPDAQRAQILEVLADARGEIQRPLPNMMRLRGAVSTLAATVQTLGSASAAYLLLKGAAALIGVHLP